MLKKWNLLIFGGNNMGLLFDEHPLILSPTLAKELGNLNEAVFVQQLHYWLENKKQAGKNFFDGRYWVYNSVEEWLKQFPWLSSATLRRTIDSLVNKGFVIRGNFNRQKLDRTIWYTINYEKIMEIDKKTKEQKDEEARFALNNSQSENNNEVQKNLAGQGTVPFAQNEQMQMIKMSKSICSKRANASAQNEQSNTIDYPLDYTETTIITFLPHPPIPVEIAVRFLKSLFEDDDETDEDDGEKDAEIKGLDVKQYGNEGKGR